MDRTPYSVAPYGEDRYPARLGPSDEFEKSGYIFVYQDVRGRWMSEGTFVEMHPAIDEKKSVKDVDESSDTYDTIEFLLKHVSNNNGKVGIWGISYPGFYTSASIIDSHPAIAAASPQAPMTDLFLGDDSYHGGAFMLSAGYGFYAPFFHAQQNPVASPDDASFSFGTTDSYKFYLEAGNVANLDKFMKSPTGLWDDQYKHDTYDDYWQVRDLSRHLKNVKCAVLVVGGWYDAEDLEGPYRTFNAIRKLNPDTPITLVEGPWVHGGWARSDGDHLGDVQFNAKTSEYFRAKFRTSWEKPEPLTPGKETAIDFTMPDLYHTFRRGHRIMVQVESSWFPLTDRNPQTFTDIPYAKPEDFWKATEEIFHQRDAASRVEVMVLPQP
jgi:putative CocE/NonD family hydrolase